MSAEVVALGLKQVGWQAFAAVGVVVGEGGGELDDRQSGQQCVNDEAAPGFLSLEKCLGEVGMQQQIFEPCVGVEGFFDPLEKGGADDAAAAPEKSDVAVFERPGEFLGGGLKLDKALGIAANLRGIERMPHGFDKRLAIVNVR